MIYFILFVLSIVSTIFVRYIALKKSLLDIPNERSSHILPTPRGGGVAIVVTFYIGLFYLFSVNQVERELFLGLLAGIPIALISFLDDIYTLSARIRLVVQTGSAFFALYLVGGFSQTLYGISLDGWFLNIFVVLCMVWLTNLFNFMDGIDGYAASEAIFISMSAYILFGQPIFLVLTVSVLGFLVFNWHKASIFMGDVGSAFLGFIFAVFVLYFSREFDAVSTWIVLLGLFWFDATLTLFRRFVNGEKISTAHKKHAFQRLVQIGFSHQKVVLIGMGINIIGFLILLLLDKNSFYLFIPIYILFIYILVLIVDRYRKFDKN